MTNKNTIAEIFFFGISGIIGYIVDVSITSLLSHLLGVYASRIPAFVAAATATWIVNRNLAFHKRNSIHNNLWVEYGHYLSLMIGGLIVNYTAYATFITIFHNYSFKIPVSVAIGSLAGMLINFVTSRKYIYKEGPTQ